MANGLQGMLNCMTEAQQQLNNELSGISDQLFYGIPKEGEWAVSEIVYHIIELQAFWIEKLNLMLSDDNPKLNRTDGERISWRAIPAAYKGYTRKLILRNLQHANVDALEDIFKLPPNQLDRTGVRTDGEVVNIPRMVQIVADHVIEHADQIAENKNALQ